MSNKIECKECGTKFSTLTTHLKRTHDLKAEQYLRKYPGSKLVSDAHREKQRLSAKTRIQADPIKYSATVASRMFDFIDNKELEGLLKRDYRSAKLCLEYQLWKPAIILYSSLLEAILIKKTREKKFYNALEAAYRNKDITETEYHKVHIIKEMRNFVHLYKELSWKTEPNEYWAKTIADMCESIIDRFKTSHRTK